MTDFRYGVPHDLGLATPELLRHNHDVLKTPSSNKYLPYIDGLRAVAVLLVIGFHAFPELFPGGFVGVDVFFVISGFLITRLILEDLESKTFQFLSFYARRVRRIFPALIAVMLITYACGWFIMFGEEFQQLGIHTFSGAAFIANIYFWLESGYFDTAASSKPLLHLWSLGIEEQFYIFWPILLFIGHRLKFNIKILLLAAFGASFAVNLLTVQDNPTNFYLPFSRFWELAMGGLLACYGLKNTKAMNSDLFSGLGFLLILISVFTLQERLYYPGMQALLPTIGTLLILFAGEESRLNQKLLSLRGMVAVGLVSYPLYLWHWPLLSLTKILLGRMPNYILAGGLMIFALLLAFMTYRFIELPMRFGTQKRTNTLILSLLMIATSILGYGTFVKNGFVFRSVVQLNLEYMASSLVGEGKHLTESCPPSYFKSQVSGICIRDVREEPGYALWGDSKGHALYWGLVRESKPGATWLFIGKAGCVPLVGAVRISSYGDDPKLCAYANVAAVDALSTNPKIKAVVIVIGARVIFEAQYVKLGSRESTPDAAKDGLSLAIKKLQEAGKKVIFVIDNPKLPDPKECNDRRLASLAFLDELLRPHLDNPNCTISYDSYLEKTKEYRALVQDLVRTNEQLSVYDPTAFLCDIDNKKCSIRRFDKFLYSYGDHISDFASSQYARDINSLLAQILKEKNTKY